MEIDRFDRRRTIVDAFCDHFRVAVYGVIKNSNFCHYALPFRYALSEAIGFSVTYFLPWLGRSQNPLGKHSELSPR